MNLKVLKITLISLGCIASSCLKRPNLTRNELSGFNVYKKNDTIIFQNLISKEKDTTIIVSKKKYHSYEPMINLKYIYAHAVVQYKNKNIKNSYNPETATMFGLCKKNNAPINPLYFNYLNSNFDLDSETQKQSVILFQSDKKIENAYLLIYHKPEFSGANEDSPEILYWDTEYGIVKFITFKGDIWERINW